MNKKFRVKRSGWINELAKKRIDNAEWKKMPKWLKEEILTQRAIIEHTENPLCEKCNKNKKYSNLNVCKPCYQIYMDMQIEKYLKGE